jgi:hypothetical protein
LTTRNTRANAASVLELSNPTGGAALGQPPITRLAIRDNEAYDPTLLDDFETFPYFWRTSKTTIMTNPEIAAGDPLALPGQGAYERVLPGLTQVVARLPTSSAGPSPSPRIGATQAD